VRLLFDQNLSPRLVKRLDDLYPDSSHVFLIGLDTASDSVIWEYARANEFMVVTKDADFCDLNVMWGSPPKIIWLRRGNCTTAEIESALRTNVESVRSLAEDDSVGILTLF
jgi:predicted nuclease of predicted toxin-antitoxin system